MTAVDRQAHTDMPRASSAVSPATKVIGVSFAAWCLGFAAVNAWQLARGELSSDRFGAYATVLTVASILVLLLKLLGAAMALVSLRSVRRRSFRWALGAALWAATSTLVLYSAGNVITTLGTMTGVLEPTEAWESAGGITIRFVAYVLFFLVGAAMAAVLAASHHRRHGLGWTVVAAGAAGGPALLGGLLVVLPALVTAISPASP